MASPVVANEWAGNFECSGPCRRKRLMGEEFSKKAMERHLKQGIALKCKICIEQAQAQERSAAAAKKQATANQDDAAKDGVSCWRTCAICQKALPQSSYNNNQWRNKKEGESKCRSCVEKSLADEQAVLRTQKEVDMQEANHAVKVARSPQEKLVAESRLSALQAQRVTGLKPVQMGRGRSRTGRGGRGGHGRSGRIGTSSVG